LELSLIHILKKGGNSIVIQGISMALTLILNWLLAHQLGTEDYGVFTYAFSWVYFFGTLSILGLDSVLQRELIKILPEKASGLIALTQKLNVFITISVIAIFSIIVLFFISNLNTEFSLMLVYAIGALPFYSQILINKSRCIGLKSVEKSLIPENIIRPLILTLLILVSFLFQTELNIKNAILFNLIAFLLAYVASILFTKNLIHKTSSPIHYENKKWYKLGLTFFILTATITINSKADILMLGFFGHTNQVGVYNIAVKLATFIALPLFVVNRIISPFISEYFKTKKNELAIVIKKSIRIIFSIGSVLILAYIFLGENILGFFGDGFKSGYWVLILLSAGQLFNLFVGPVGNVLTMSQYEKLALKSMIISTVINLSLNLILIPIYEMNGAAIATFVSLLYWNIAQFYIVKKKLNLNVSVI
jgi:O-antigen/teichoic acid export membrane protein